MSSGFAKVLGRDGSEDHRARFEKEFESRAIGLGERLGVVVRARGYSIEMRFSIREAEMIEMLSKMPIGSKPDI